MDSIPNQGTNQFKVPLIGDADVGKTSLVTRLTTDRFSDNTTPTVGVSNAHVTIKVGGTDVVLHIWDTAGQEKFRSLVPLYTRHSSLLLLVFDVSNRESFDSLEEWITKIRNEMELKSPIVICANKIDLHRLAAREEIEAFSAAHCCKLFYTSAQTGEGVNEMFNAIAEMLAEKDPQRKDDPRQLEPGQKGKCC